MPSVIDENTQFIDESTNTPISNGYIYIGTQNLDAKLNTITIYSDRALTTVIANPQRTGADGRSVNKIWVPGKYSIKVEDSANVQKLNNLDRGESVQIGNTILDNESGTNAVVATGSPTITTLIDKQTYIFTAPNTNTGAMTLKIDGTAVIAIKKLHDVALVAGDIEANQQIAVIYNATDTTYEILSNTLFPNKVLGSDFLISPDGTDFTPGRQLVVYNQTANGTGVQIADGTTGNSASDGFQLLLSSSQEAQIRQYESLDMSFYTGGTKQFYIDDSTDGVVVGAPSTNEGKGVGTVNAANGFYDNGVRIKRTVDDEYTASATTASVSATSYLSVIFTHGLGTDDVMVDLMMDGDTNHKWMTLVSRFDGGQVKLIGGAVQTLVNVDPPTLSTGEVGIRIYNESILAQTFTYSLRVYKLNP